MITITELISRVRFDEGLHVRDTSISVDDVRLAVEQIADENLGHGYYYLFDGAERVYNKSAGEYCWYFAEDCPLSETGSGIDFTAEELPLNSKSMPYLATEVRSRLAIDPNEKDRLHKIAVGKRNQLVTPRTVREI